MEQKAGSSRFDYVRYDDGHTTMQALFKARVTELDGMISAIEHGTIAAPGAMRCIGDLGRYKALARTALEEVYMWVGKAIRDHQCLVNATTQLEESRGEG